MRKLNFYTIDLTYVSYLKLEFAPFPDPSAQRVPGIFRPGFFHGRHAFPLEPSNFWMDARKRAMFSGA